MAMGVREKRTKKQMRMRGVEKNISLRDAKFVLCQPEVCVRACVLSRVL